MALRVSRTSAGSRKPTSAMPTAGLLRVQCNSNFGRVLSYLHGKALAIQGAARSREKYPARPGEMPRISLQNRGFDEATDSLEPHPRPSPKPIVVGRFIAAARRPHAGAALSGVDRL